MQDLSHWFASLGLTASDLLYICAIFFLVLGIGKLVRFRLLSAAIRIGFAMLLYAGSLSLDPSSLETPKGLPNVPTEGSIIPKMDLHKAVDKIGAAIKAAKDAIKE